MDSHFHFRDAAATALPREKIRKYGIHVLATEELVHTILGSGNHHHTVQTLAKKISQLIQTKKQIELSDLLSIKGIGEAKACQILAAIELVERIRPIGFP